VRIADLGPSRLVCGVDCPAVGVPSKGAVVADVVFVIVIVVVFGILALCAKGAEKL
jgi:hypothetical protein